MCQQQILDQSRFYTYVGFGSGILSIVYVFYMKQTAVCFYDVFKIRPESEAYLQISVLL